jgi:exodeoxyribonuclease-3
MPTPAPARPAVPHLRLYSWNVNGIRAGFKKGTFIEFLQTHQPDILGVQETKAEEEQVTASLKEIGDYHWTFACGARKGYSGTAVFSKVKPAATACDLGIPACDGEGRVVRAEFADFILFNVYFPNGKSREERLRYKMDFYEAFQKMCVELVAQGKNVVVCGDVNTAHREIDLARPKANSKISGFLPEERAWMDRFLAAGFHDVFREKNPDLAEQYTWWDMQSGARARNVGWRIDYFFVNTALLPRVENAFILPDVLGSDHCPVGLDLRI